MIKKIFFFLIFSYSFSYSQSLNFQETKNYIDNLLKNGSIYLDKDGTLSIKYIAYEIGGKVNKVSQFNTADIKFGAIEPYSTGDFGITVKCIEKHNCIKSSYSYIDMPSYQKNESENWFPMYPHDGSKISAQKLRNAFEYFVDFAKEQGYKRPDDDYDPFSPKNYSSKESKITSNNGINNDAIKLEKRNNVYYIDISVNGMNEKFILDTGASEVTLNEELERDLISKNLLKKDDYISPGLYRIADGSIVSNRRLIISKLKIGKFIVENVKANVAKSNAPLLLGKSLLDKFSKWSIDNQKMSLQLNE